MNCELFLIITITEDVGDLYKTGEIQVFSRVGTIELNSNRT